MREIKFRVWVNEWNRLTKEHELKPYFEYFDNDGSYISSRTGMKKQHIEQYTGLKDKNGVDIYEGDIVKVKNKLNGRVGEYNTQIIFKDGMFKLKENKTIFKDGYIYLHEIIGNIHQNKELL